FDGHTDWVNGAAVSPDGKRGLSAGRDGTARVWDLQTGKQLRQLKVGGNCEAVAFAPDGKRALCGGSFGLILWDSGTAREVRRFPTSPWTYRAIFTPDGKRILSTAPDMTVRVWDVETGEELCRYRGHQGYVRGMAVTPDGRRALSVNGQRWG